MVQNSAKFILYYPCRAISRHIDYFHYKMLARLSYPIFTVNPASGIIGNKCYGNLWAVKNATGEAFHKNCLIEHGLYFGEYVFEKECTLKSINTIYTYSEYRKTAILKWFHGKLDKQIIPIGPYILYADYFKKEAQLRKLKESLGRVLLVFPSHPSPEAKPLYDFEEFCKEIDKLSKNYDTILISLFYLDVLKGYGHRYEKKGYKIVCSGARTDRWFLSRQKDLISLADMTMSNDVGTHIGYSIAMGVPHYIFKQEIYMEGHAEEYSLDETQRIRATEYKEIISVFNHYNESITKEQKRIVDYYWGVQE